MRSVREINGYNGNIRCIVNRLSSQALSNFPSLSGDRLRRVLMVAKAIIEAERKTAPRYCKTIRTVPELTIVD